MTSEEIRIALFKLRGSGVNMAQIARSLDPPCTRQAISSVIERAIASRRIMLAVSDAINIDPRVVFPEYFKRKKK
ncbi:MAG: hypothetical protein GY859_43755 [Desulfobacterales bacterium]|nr:hypothetical protein [Desulfobacterales bacterium]